MIAPNKTLSGRDPALLVRALAGSPRLFFRVPLSFVVRRHHDARTNVQMKIKIEQLITGSGVLVVALIVTACGDQAQNPHATSRERSAAIQCGVNLRTIDGAKTVWAQEHNKTTNDIPTESDLFGPGRYIADRSTVGCPIGGTLTIGHIGEKPKCSVAGHTYPE